MTLSQIIAILELTPGTLRGLMLHATEEDFTWQPSPQRWSFAMVLAHLAEVEKQGFMDGFRAIEAAAGAFLPAYDQLALFRTGKKFDAQREYDSFARQRASTLAWLRARPEGIGSRTGRHETFGLLSFDQLLHEFAFHDLGHIRQIMELYRTHALYPHMSAAFQEYYQVNP